MLTMRSVQVILLDILLTIRQKTKCGLRVGRMRKIDNELDNQDEENELR